MKCAIFSLTTLILSAASLSLAAAPMQLHIDPTKGKTEFVAVGKPAMLKIHGEGTGPSGELSIEQGTLTGKLKVSLSNLNTGISMRDTHMKEKYLETSKYPDAELSLNKVPFPELKTGQHESVPFKGVLALHGVSRPVDGNAEIEARNDGYHVKSQFKLNLSDFKIEIPSYMGIKVADTVEVEVPIDVTR